MSLRGDKYETSEEVKTRLESSVVLYDNRPVYISRVANVDGLEGDNKEIARVYFFELPYKGRAKEGEVRKYLSSKKFDLTPFKMGYVNIGGEATYVSRHPHRQYKQGLSQATTVCTDIKGHRSEDVGFQTLVSSQGFVDMFDNKYPSFKEAGELIGAKENSSVAVSKSFAFFIDHDLETLFLMNKGVKCGLARRGDKSLVIPPKFHFLREEMEEHRIPIS